MPNSYTIAQNPLAHFFTHVRFDGDCWLWIGDIDRDGYGRVGTASRTRRAHRWLYERLVCPVPRELTLDHLCRVKNCVNVFDHLEPVTVAVNILRGTRHGTLYCPRNHLYDEENTYRNVNTGKRTCRACQKIHRRAWQSRQEVSA